MSCAISGIDYWLYYWIINLLILQMEQIQKKKEQIFDDSMSFCCFELDRKNSWEKNQTCWNKENLKSEVERTKIFWQFSFRNKISRRYKTRHLKRKSTPLWTLTSNFLKGLKNLMLIPSMSLETQLFRVIHNDRKLPPPVLKELISKYLCILWP